MENLDKNNKDKAVQLLKEVENLAAEGNNQKQIAKTLGFKTTFTLNNRLVKASQTHQVAVFNFSSTIRSLAIIPTITPSPVPLIFRLAG